jgi:signal transduction histidine kinase
MSKTAGAVTARKSRHSVAASSKPARLPGENSWSTHAPGLGALWTHTNRDIETWDNIFHESDRERLRTHWRSGKGEFQEICRLCPLNQQYYRWCILRSWPMDSFISSPIGSPSVSKDPRSKRIWMTVTVDIHDLKLAENELVIKIEYLTASLYGVSHETREPLRAINTRAELLRRRIDWQMDPTADSLMSDLWSAVERLTNLTTSLLRLGDAASGNTELIVRPFNAMEAVSAALRSLGARIGSDTRIKIDDPLPDVIGDPVLLTQVFENLIGNALKFVRPHNPADIRIHSRVVGTNHVFSVQDAGIGFPPDDAPRLFRPFERLHGHEYSGSGLGLALCKAIIERHRGCIWASSTPEGGATFLFSLPLNAS